MADGVELAEVGMPDFGLPAAEPSVPTATYQARLAAAADAAAAAGLDALLVYADREHFANLAYLTRFDPRFEEALLILVPGRAPVLLVGNEGVAYAAVVPPGVEVDQVPELQPGQPAQGGQQAAPQPAGRGRPGRRRGQPQRRGWPRRPAGRHRRLEVLRPGRRGGGGGLDRGARLPGERAAGAGL